MGGYTYGRGKMELSYIVPVFSLCSDAVSEQILMCGEGMKE